MMDQHDEVLADLEVGTVFECINTTDSTTTPKCLLPQGQSFRGVLEELTLLNDPANNVTIYVGAEGMCKFPLVSGGVGLVLKKVNPQNVFFTGNGTAGLIIHGISGGVVVV